VTQWLHFRVWGISLPVWCLNSRNVPLWAGFWCSATTWATHSLWISTPLPPLLDISFLVNCHISIVSFFVFFVLYKIEKKLLLSFLLVLIRTAQILTGSGQNLLRTTQILIWFDLTNSDWFWSDLVGDSKVLSQGRPKRDWKTWQDPLVLGDPRQGGRSKANQSDCYDKCHGKCILWPLQQFPFICRSQQAENTVSCQ